MECGWLIALASLLGIGAGVTVTVVIRNIRITSNRVRQRDVSAGGDVVAGDKKTRN